MTAQIDTLCKQREKQEKDITCLKAELATSLAMSNLQARNQKGPDVCKICGKYYGVVET